MFLHSWQQEKWSHGNSFHPDSSFMNSNIRPLISPSSSWHRSEAALLRSRTLEVMWETGSVHVLSDRQSRAAAISLTPISLKTFSHVFHNRSQQIRYIMRTLFEPNKEACLVKIYHKSVMWTYSFNTTHTAHRLLCIPLSEPFFSDAFTHFQSLINKIQFYLFV